MAGADARVGHLLAAASENFRSLPEIRSYAPLLDLRQEAGR